MKSEITRNRKYIVSTIKLNGYEWPWETLVFEFDGTFCSGAEVFGRRWQTEQDALAGHAALVKEYGA